MVGQNEPYVRDIHHEHVGCKYKYKEILMTSMATLAAQGYAGLLLDLTLTIANLQVIVRHNIRTRSKDQRYGDQNAASTVAR